MNNSYQYENNLKIIKKILEISTKQLKVKELF